MLENIARELPIVRALLDDRERIRRAEQLADLRELHRHHFAEERAEGDAGEVIALSSDTRAARAVVTVFGLIQRLLHEPRECHRSALRDLDPQFVCEW